MAHGPSRHAGQPPSHRLGTSSVAVNWISGSNRACAGMRLLCCMIRPEMVIRRRQGPVSMGRRWYLTDGDYYSAARGV